MVQKNSLSSDSEGLSLQESRLNFQPPLPLILQRINQLTVEEEDSTGGDLRIDPGLSDIFPHSSKLPILHFKEDAEQTSDALRIGVLFSGGPASGGHNVLTGLFDALMKIHPASQLIGFLNGPAGLIQNNAVELTNEKIAPYRNQGGFDLIGTGRTKIETTDQFESAAETIRSQHLDGLVIVGGDDSNTNAAFLAEYCDQNRINTRIIGVPKTIDGDLKNAFIETSFGFDSASKVYSELIGNLAKDSLSQKKYTFFVKLMGRSASHLTLECALKTHINLALIGEEIASNQSSLSDVVNEIADLICARANRNKHYGVILIPEGLLEFIPECRKMIEELNRCLLEHDFISQPDQEERMIEFLNVKLTTSSFEVFLSLPHDIRRQLLLDRDPHGNVQLSKIETERLLIALVAKELETRKSNGKYTGKFNPQPQFFGYEGRCGFPSTFDCNYCYSLGYLAALLIKSNASGYMCSITNLSHPVEQWNIAGVPIVKMLHFETRKEKKQAVIKKALVDLEAAPFRRFKENRSQWALVDDYCCPGPIQFFGCSRLVDSPPYSLMFEGVSSFT